MYLNTSPLFLFQSFFKDILLYFLKIQKLIYLYFHGPSSQYS